MRHETTEKFLSEQSAGAAKGAIWDGDREAQVQHRLASARRAFSTRNADLQQAARLDRHSRPQAGDLVLAKVVAIGHHTKLESPAGRRQALYPGDEIIVAFGNRYAPDQFEAKVPAELGPCDLVAGGGIASKMLAKNARTRNPTRIEPIGLLADREGKILNLAQFTPLLDRDLEPAAGCRVIVVVGTSMNAGKTTTVARLIHGLTLAGFRVGAAKVTGTGSGGDLWAMRDAGAAIALDFTDAGHATTAGVPIARLVEDSLRLIASVARGHDVAIVEVADGLFQEETAALLRSARFAGVIDHIILAAGDAMGAAFGCQWLQRHGLPLSLIAGCVSSSPLGSRETEQATGLNVASLSDLADPQFAPGFCFADQPAVRAIREVA